MSKILIRLPVTLILIAVAGPVVWTYFFSLFPHAQGVNPDIVISITAFSLGVVTFFGVAALNSSGQDPQVLGGDRLRTAIACSLIFTYLFIVCFTTFVWNSASVGAVTREFMTSFSNVVGITIAFYFGASAATQIFGKRTGEQLKANTGTVEQDGSADRSRDPGVPSLKSPAE